MSDFLKAFDAGRNTATQVIRESALLGDPAGLESQRPKLRALGKWRFILIRGIIGFGGPCCVWLVLRNLSEDIDVAHRFHQSVLTHLLQSWLFALGMCAFLGFIVGLLAWRRISESWPGEPPNPEAPTTTLGL